MSLGTIYTKCYFGKIYYISWNRVSSFPFLSTFSVDRIQRFALFSTLSIMVCRCKLKRLANVSLNTSIYSMGYTWPYCTRKTCPEYMSPVYAPESWSKTFFCTIIAHPHKCTCFERLVSKHKTIAMNGVLACLNQSLCQKFTLAYQCNLSTAS